MLVTKYLNESLTEMSNVKYTKVKVQTWLKKVDGSTMSGKYKAWIYGILERLMWMILKYEVLVTAAEAMERPSSGKQIKWQGAPKLFTLIGLYKSSKLQFPLSSFVECKVAKCA
jgi:hypothetical protein